MMQVVILLCATGLARAECTTETAVAVIQGPPASGPMMCGLHGQAYIADGALAAWLEDGHYMKLRCTPGGRPGTSAEARRAGSP